MAGPLDGFRIIEFAGIGPAPFAAMMLSDMGAEVTTIHRPGRRPEPTFVDRGRRALGVDVKRPEGRELVARLVTRSDALVEGFRPGVMERLGLGPEPCRELNPRLVYGRMTGWGQDGPLSSYAGHDINYIALTGALWATGRAGDRPVPPLNLVGDYGGGGMLLAFGLVCALLEASRSGEGQVVDAAIVDGVSLLTTFIASMRAAGRWRDARGANPLDTGFPHYEVYECADGRYVAIGALEPAFYDELVRLTGFPERGQRHDRNTFASRREQWAKLFQTKTRDEWAAIAERSDACLTPVLDWEEAPRHHHLRARRTFVEVDGRIQPAAAPRFNRTPGELRTARERAGGDAALLADLGLTPADIARLRADGVLDVSPDPAGS